MVVQAVAEIERLRILGLVEGDHRTAMSGVAGYVLDALGGHFDIVGRLDYSPHGAARMALALATARPRRDAWRARFHTGLTAQRALSRTLSRRLDGSTIPFDIALQVHGWVAGQPEPYALYVDQTRLMAERGWPQWIPIARRERRTVLAREREMYVAAAHLFAMGDPARESLQADYGIDPAAITVVGGGLNARVLPDPRPMPMKPTILFVGRDFERKGGDVLLESFSRVRARLPDAELHIVGVSRRFDVPGVISHGKVSDREALDALYRQTKVFTLPSRYEPWGFVLPEAMSHGIPCVGTAVQSIPEILGFGAAGPVVAPGDAAALAEALMTVLGDDGLAARLGAEGRRLVQERHRWEHVAARMAPALTAAARPGDSGGRHRLSYRRGD